MRFQTKCKCKYMNIVFLETARFFGRRTLHSFESFRFLLFCFGFGVAVAVIAAAAAVTARYPITAVVVVVFN